MNEREQWVRLGNNVRHLRIKDGLSQQKLAQEVGMSRVSLSQKERGLRSIDAFELMEFCDVFGVDPRELANAELYLRG